MENKKEVVFDDFLQTEHLDCFEKNVVGDEDGTIVYRSYVQTNNGDIPVFVMLDNTIYSVVRFVVGPHVVTADNRLNILDFINKENAKYKSFKYYVEDEDQTLYLDVVHMAGTGSFEPALIYVLMRQVVEYLPTVEGELLKAFGVALQDTEEEEEGTL